jgi:DNA invertase Pin-like site-specific DNA recombinase
LRAGDVLTVTKTDRLGRSVRNTVALLHELSERGISFKSIAEGFDTSSPAGLAMIQLVAVFAELELSKIRERTRLGLKTARDAGRIGGRPPALTPTMVGVAQKLYSEGVSVINIAAELGCSRSTAYRAIESRSDARYGVSPLSSHTTRDF